MMFLLFAMLWLMGIGAASLAVMYLDTQVSGATPPPAIKLALVVLWPAFFMLVGVAGLMDRFDEITRVKQ